MTLNMTLDLNNTEMLTGMRFFRAHCSTPSTCHHSDINTNPLLYILLQALFPN